MLFGLFMQRVLFLPLAILLELNFALERLLVARGVVVDVFAHRTLEFDQIVL